MADNINYLPVTQNMAVAAALKYADFVKNVNFCAHQIILQSLRLSGRH